jgi:hypothetical protein
MSDDFENEVRTALREGSATITEETLRKPVLASARRSGLRTWSVAACAALVVIAVPVAVVAVVADPPSGSTSASAPYLGYQWQVESITSGGTTTQVPSSLDASVTFFDDGRMLLRDTVNALSSIIDPRADGFSARTVGSTLALYGGDDVVRRLVIATMADLSSTGRAVVSVTDTQLVIDTGGYRLTLVRGAATGDGGPSTAPR